MNVRSNKRLILSLLPFFLAILVMTPRLISPQFGLLDDGLMLERVTDILSNDFSMRYDLQAGRFRPIYWLYFTLIFIVAGMRPFWFFFSHLILFLVLLLQIRLLMKKMNADNKQILIASLIFIFSMPIIENFYTLGKGEPLQLVFLLSALVCFEELKNSIKKGERWLASILTFIFILAAILVKETAILIAPLAAVWFGYTWIKRNQYSEHIRKTILVFLLIATASIAAFFILRYLWGSTSLTGGTYTEKYDFSISLLVEKTLRWVTQLSFYFHYLIPMFLLLLIIILKKRISDEAQKQNIFNWTSWSLFWIVVLIPWDLAEVYYLLPFSLGIAILIGLLWPYIIDMIRDRQKTMKWTALVLSSLTLILFLIILPSFRTDALTQLTIDRVNKTMLEVVQEIIPEDGDFFVGMDSHNEYFMNIEYFLVNRYDRDDIFIDFVSLDTLGRMHHYSNGIVILPYIRNQAALGVRLGVEEEFTMAWRDIIVFEMGDRLTALAEIRDDIRLFNINLPVIFCPLLHQKGYCDNPDPIIDTRFFSFGWEAYHIR